VHVLLSRVDLTLDCVDAQALAASWKVAVGYADEPPPPPFRTRQEWLHLDLRVSGTGTPEERWTRVMDEVARLQAAGASTFAVFEGHHVSMTDPQGNEFCVA
jgi:hypothetical protein